MKNIYLLALILLSFTTFGQESRSYLGTAYNRTQQVGGVLRIDLTFNSDGTLSGYVDNDPYPTGLNFCGAGNVSGEWTPQRVHIRFTMDEPDPNCGRLDGSTADYYLNMSPDGQVLSGTFLLGYDNSTGEIYVRSAAGCPDLQSLRAIYQSHRRTNSAAYARQYLCLAEKTCAEYNRTDATGWAGGFVNYLFDWMSTHNQSNTGLDVTCDDSTSNYTCFTKAGVWHLAFELGPAFFNYCDQVQSTTDITRWTSDHEQFLTNAVIPCFAELSNSNELCSSNELLCQAFIGSSREFTLTSVRHLRDAAQAYCLGRLAGSSLVSLAARMPAPLTQSTLFSESIHTQSDLDISAQDFFVRVGNRYQLQVVRSTSTGQPQNVSSGYHTRYWVSTPAGIAQVDSNGVLQLNGTYLPLSCSRAPLYVFAECEGRWGIGQFAIVDQDTDNDLIVDSYERRNGLNPNYPNSLSSDYDNDGLSDFFEQLQRTNPRNRDSDGDSFSDAYETSIRVDPLDSARTPISTKVAEHAVYQGVSVQSVYPNPFSDYLIVDFTVDKPLADVQLTILDALGRVVFEKKYATPARARYSEELPTSFGPGVYTLLLRASDGTLLRQRISGI